MNKLPSYGFLLLLASLFAFGFSFVMHRQERAKKTWPSVSGEMLDSNIIRTTKAYLQTPTVNRTMRDDKSYSNSDVWALDVQYRYQVAGQAYTGTRATATDHVEAISDHPNEPTQQMTSWKDQLPKGATVTVHYDPSEPTESYLLYNESAALSTVFNIGVALLVLGIVLIAAPRVLS